ncbi:MAG: hypothetical protein WDO24_01900 [Pseudomonadota bacterium]
MTRTGPRKLPPLTALALYDDFRDLTPPGPRGDKMIQNLADRLVAMDLLDRAGELLDYQIKNRLSGTEKARIGARLAVVQMLDPQAGCGGGGARRQRSAQAAARACRRALALEGRARWPRPATRRPRWPCSTATPAAMPISCGPRSS